MTDLMNLLENIHCMKASHLCRYQSQGCAIIPVRPMIQLKNQKHYILMNGVKMGFKKKFKIIATFLNNVALMRPGKVVKLQPIFKYGKIFYS